MSRALTAAATIERRDDGHRHSGRRARLRSQARAGLVDGSAVRGRVGVLRGRGDGVSVGIRAAPRDRRDVLRRLALLHDRRVPPVRAGGQRRTWPAATRRWRPASWEPRRIDWLAATVQLIGTLLFNVSTFEGMKRGLSAREANLRVWAPDAFGSIAFLVASELAFAETCHRWFCIRRRSVAWRIAALNLLGSIAFGVAAIAAIVEPSNDEPVSAAVSNAGTAAGAICFLGGGLLLIAQARRGSVTAPARTTPR
jgi:YrhK-like protein